MPVIIRDKDGKLRPSPVDTSPPFKEIEVPYQNPQVVGGSCVTYRDRRKQSEDLEKITLRLKIPRD